MKNPKLEAFTPKPPARVEMSGGTALAEMAKAERVKNRENSVTDSAGIG
jgi:hypothetical protein